MNWPLWLGVLVVVVVWVRAERESPLAGAFGSGWRCAG